MLKHGQIVGERRINETEVDEILYMIVAGQDPRTRGAKGVG